MVSKYRLMMQGLVGRIQSANRRLGTADAAKTQKKEENKMAALCQARTQAS
jgi:hypothetical protein